MWQKSSQVGGSEVNSHSMAINASKTRPVIHRFQDCRIYGNLVAKRLRIDSQQGEDGTLLIL